MIDELLVAPFEGGIGAAACAGGRLEDFVAAPESGALEPGAIHRARVLQRRGGLVFAGTVAGEVAFEAGDAPPRAGELVTLQVSAPPRDGKPARATRRIGLGGALLALVPGGDHASTSARVAGAEARRALAARVRRLVPEGFGAIARLAAVEADDAELAAEAASLAASWRRVEGADAAEPALLREETAAARAARPLLGAAPARIVAADAALARALASGFPAFAARIAVAEEGAALFDRYGVAEALAIAAGPRVPLAGGAALTIERAAALTAIDVDSGAAPPARANAAAAAEIPRQLRLRDAIGPVLVDFIRGPAGARRPLEAALARGLALDRREVAVLGWTRGGMLELARGGGVVI